MHVAEVDCADHYSARDERHCAPAVVDLAINAEPMPVPEPRPERRRAASSRQDVEQAIRELPVLLDVVTDLSVNVNVVPDVSPPDLTPEGRGPDWYPKLQH
jgi:hypothetical protein